MHPDKGYQRRCIPIKVINADASRPVALRKLDISYMAVEDPVVFSGRFRALRSGRLNSTNVNLYLREPLDSVGAANCKPISYHRWRY